MEGEKLLKKEILRWINLVLSIAYFLLFIIFVLVTAFQTQGFWGSKLLALLLISVPILLPAVVFWLNFRSLNGSNIKKNHNEFY